MNDPVIFSYICVFATWLFCVWSGAVAITTKAEHIPLGDFGRAFLILNAFCLGITCAAVLIFKFYEVIHGAY